MNPHNDKPIDRILHDLQERAKELNCLYRVDELLGREEAPLDEVLGEVIRTIPAGWQFPDVCVARIALGNRAFEPSGFSPSPFKLVSLIEAQGEIAGQVEVYYTEAMPRAAEGPFLAEERKLLDAIAERLGHFVSRRRLRRVLAADGEPGAATPEWWVVLDFLRQTDRALLGRLGRKMINHLCWNGFDDAERLLRSTVPARTPSDGENFDDNRPQPRTARAADPETTEAAFRIAGKNLPEDEILNCIQSWIKEDKSTFLKNALERMDTPLAELADALQRFRHGGVEEGDLSTATQIGLRAALVRRFLTDQLEFVNIAKDYLTVGDFHELCQRIVYPPRSHGRLGGKAAGLYLASKIVARSPEYHDVLGDIRIPRSWHIPSDGILDFIHHNDLEDVYNRKYTDPDRVRLDYPYIVQLFKNSFFSADILRGLSDVLDDLDGRPIIVRSSSLLEDRLGSAFSGKYKSLFLANTGTKRERMAALTDAIAEVYASVFSPDPIEYRALRGLLDLHEEMGILDPGGGGHAHRALLDARLLRGGLLEQRVPLVLADRAGGRPAADRPGARHPRGRPPGRRLPRPGGPRPAGPPRQPDARGGAALLAEEGGRHQPRDRRLRDRRHAGAAGAARRRVPARAPDDLDRRPRPPAAAGGARGLLEGRRRPLVRGAHLGQPVHDPHADAPAGAAGEAQEPGGHRVRLGRAARVPAPVPAPGRHRGGRPRPHPPRPAARPGALHRPPLRLERAGERRQPRRVRGPRGVRPAGARPDPRGRARGRPPQPAAAEAPVHPDGPGPLGLARGHPARRARHLRRHLQRGGADRGRPQEGRLHPRPLLRHPLLPGPGRVEHPLPAALPRRPRGRLQRGLLPALAERARRASPRSSRGSPTSCA